ncbi:uncharacterized protein TEOVI_000592300 [Trypanosoma equiperdum]|uniref:Uncharacterized protein n=3 Tax=Trypanozoon TaxID=39700 RepID=Q57XB4_TRYB2|nr:hypothetical protein, conserved [Trypanosoma brucei brucei TREU927]AAX69755.1 hypothetical protein, conserved [Trypanosoma brucei]AAZ13042.1 hypothetical protein, conserved [Trypanosoma brucei brucei TREU927]RHW71066.1 hypothetical protein DPX39_080028300 [Trypanosoma brucei equiperdum]SCU66197.1 hypothetical protein, conserved [Trypanosoma equiperdum]
MRCSARLAAVFTPAMPHLDAFLRRHTRPDHRLRHHPLWLSEEDLQHLGNISIDRTNHCGSSLCKADGPLPTVLVEAPRTVFLYNMDQLPPECEVRWQFPPVDVPSSVSSMTGYKLKSRELLEKARHEMGYESNWWGTKAAWAKKGVMVDMNLLPTPVPSLHVSQFLHISFLVNGDHVLKNSYISGKTGSLKSWTSHEGVPSAYEDFQRLVKEHMQAHSFASPLYFSESSLRNAGISIRPGVQPLDFSDVQHTNSYIGNRKLALQELTTTYQQYYHLSQLVFPAGYRIPRSVVEVERQNPGVPIHGMTGRLLSVPELHPEAIVNSSAPELAPFVMRGSNETGSNEPNNVSSVVDLESPCAAYGRNLWYLPQDVLEAGGVVDPNAMPVEAAVGSHSDKRRRKLYNVEQLVIPLEGYKAVGCIATMNRFVQSDKPPCAGTLAGDELG